MFAGFPFAGAPFASTGVRRRALVLTLLGLVL